ncbi:MAG: thiamine pyrophosphate-dependent dehydrogenase E1 component subunit alpha [Thermodesulfobacteriota bacterium]
MDAGTLKQLFYQMLRIRVVEEMIADLYPEQEMRCPVHLCVGQEAVSAGVCLNLTPDDYVLSNHRSHGHYLAKGGDLKAMMAEIYGKVTGCCLGKGGSMHLIDLPAGFLGAVPIVGSTIPMAVGAALGSTMLGEDRVTVVFFGEGATEEGVFHESLNFAVLKGLPVVFICENNFFSVYSPLSVRQPPGREIYRLAQGYGIESHQGDGNDVVEVYRLARQAVGKAKEGGGPTFLEFITYRWREHCGPYYDNHLGYRAECDFLEWQARCPLDRFKERLLADGLLSLQEMGDMENQIKTEMAEAVAFAKKSPFPSEDLLLKDVYAP